jgi:hypothetical protein
MSGNIYFGIPQIGYVNSEGDFLENKQLEQDYEVYYDYNVVSQGEDQQLKKAVEILLEELGQKK